MRTYSIYLLLTWCSAGLLWIGMQVLGAMLARSKWWRTMAGILIQFPVLCWSIGQVSGAEKYVDGFTSKLWLSVALPFVLFVVAQFLLCGRDWRRGIYSSLLPLAVAVTAVCVSLGVCILIVPDVMNLLRHFIYEYNIVFFRTQIAVSVLLFGMTMLLIQNRTPLVFKYIAASILLLAGVGLGVYALFRGAVVGEYMSGDARNVLLAAFMLAAFYLLAVFYYISRQRRRSFENQLITEKKRFEEDRHNDAEAIWANVRKVRHDIKQHLTVLSCYLEEGKTEECKQYLDDLLNNVERMGNLIQSKNRVLDYLINSKLCNLTDTEVVVAGSVGDFSDISDRDLASIVGNLLDNAVEAVAEASEKRIELHFVRMHSNRVLICKNTVSSPVLATNPQLRSTKGGGKHLGLGTHIIRETVEKYNGMTDFFEDHEMFCAQIVLPLPYGQGNG
ncbi:MAG: GHKL domain-containing protein [Clostridia bacterium]|nr:GHKL domain-containing protein [Clostridia bacterium]